MTFMTIFALTGCVVSLTIGGLSIFGEQGPIVDLRRRNRRAPKWARNTGRRAEDLAA